MRRSAAKDRGAEPRRGGAAAREAALGARGASAASIAAAFAFCAALLAACAGGPNPATAGPGKAATSGLAPHGSGGASGARSGPGGGAAPASAERALLAGLPGPAAEFALEFLARVSAGDWAWISAAAEPAFMRAWGPPPGAAGAGDAGRLSGQVYGPELLARLVHAERAASAAGSGAPPRGADGAGGGQGASGRAARPSPPAFSGDEGGPLRVEPRLVRRALYLAARTEGPVALVSGRLELEGGAVQAFELRILHRLTPPRLAGELP